MANKTKLYDVRKEEQANLIKSSFYEFIIYMFAYSIVLLLGTKIFSGFNISGFGYAFLAACIISLLESFLKPTLMILTLPITIITAGILYPLSNMIILWLTSMILGDNFVLGGFASTFFLSIFLAALRYIVDKAFVEKIVGGK